MNNLVGNAIVKNTSTDDVVRTIQALIAAGYRGDELLEKIDAIYGVGARNNLLKTIDYIIPTTHATIIVEYPSITPSEKTKIGDILIGSNGFIGQITEVSFDSDNVVSSVTILGLGYDIIESILPGVTAEDNDNVLKVVNGSWNKGIVNMAEDLTILCPDSVGNIRLQDTDETNRFIDINSVFVPYGSDDETLSLEFLDDSDRVVRLSSVADPKSDTDATNKRYVDNKDKPISLTFDELVLLEENAGLIPGQKYRITDYEPYIPSSAEDYAIADNSNPFDIIVTAVETDYLSSYASVCSRENNYSWDESDLDKWQIMFDLIVPKGYIAWMRDEKGNECPYDFKHIKFKRYLVTDGPSDLIGSYSTDNIEGITVDTDNYKYFYTFSAGTGSFVTDASLDSYIRNNKIERYYDNNVQKLNNIVIRYNYLNDEARINYVPNTFGPNCANITLNKNCFGNVFDRYCNNILFGENCLNNRFLNTDELNEFDSSNIVFSNYCGYNTFNAAVSECVFGTSCSHNVFGSSEEITFGGHCAYNTLKNNCSNIVFGDGYIENTFGNGCHNIVFISDNEEETVYNYVRFNTIGDYVENLRLYHDGQSGEIHYCIVLPGTQGTISDPEVIEVPVNATTCTIIGTITPQS